MQNQELRSLAKQLKDNLSRLMEKRSTWESHWQEVSDFMLPRKAEITKERAQSNVWFEMPCISNASAVVEFLIVSAELLERRP